jgi:anaerobic selenocysteine-containing dehydrogenase
MASPPQTVPTFCRVCEPSCGLVAQVRDGELVALRPDRDHPVTAGFACNKGIAGREIHRDPDRLGQPLRRRVGGGFDAVGWDEAVEDVAARLGAIRDAHGPDAIAFYMGNPLAFNALAGPAVGSFAAQLGTRRHFGSGTQDCSNKFAAGEAVFGSSTLHPVPDLDHTDFLLVFGANPRVSHMSFLSIADPMSALRGIEKRGGRVVHVNPRRVEGVRDDQWVAVRPDSDVYLMAGLLCEMERQGLWREDVLAEHASHVEALRAFVRRHPPERVAGVTGVPADAIRRLAAEFAAAPSASVYMSTGVNMGRQGTLAYWLLFMLSLVTGNLDRRGGNLYSLGFYPAPKAGRTDPDRHFFEGPHGRIRRIRGALPGNLLADMVLNDPEPVRALVVVAGNPVLSVGGGERMREALSRLELLVCVDLYRNATGELAHYLLPATDMFERRDINLCGLGMQHRPFVQYTDAVVPPRDERREEWWIFARLEQAMGMKSALDHGDDPPVFSRIDHMLARSGLSIERLRQSEHGTAVLPEPEPGRFYSDWIQTRDKRVDCCPPLFAEALERCDAIFAELESESEDQLKLITRRDNSMHNSWYQNVEVMKRRHSLDNPLYVHPADAERLGFADGDRVSVASGSGRLEARAVLDDTLRPGVVAMTHGWGNERTPGMRVAHAHPGINANELLPTGPGSFEPLSNQAFMTGIPVRVEAAS